MYEVMAERYTPSYPGVESSYPCQRRLKRAMGLRCFPCGKPVLCFGGATRNDYSVRHFFFAASGSMALARLAESSNRIQVRHGPSFCFAVLTSGVSGLDAGLVLLRATSG